MATPEKVTPEVAAPSAPVAGTTAVPVPAKKKSNKTLWIILSLVVFFFVIVPGVIFAAGALWLNSNNNAEKASENALESIIGKATDGKVDIDSKNGSFSVESKDGDSSVAYGDQKLPTDFPKDKIPYIKEKSVTFVLTSSSEGKKNWSVSTTVDKSYDDAVAYFEGKIVEPEYQNTSTYGTSDSKSILGKNATHSLFITVTKGTNGDPTGVTYIVTEE